MRPFLRRILLLLPVSGAALLGALMPVRHAARVETAEGNPVQRVVLESRTLLGIQRPAWGARLQGHAAWGSAGEGFFLAPTAPTRVTVKAWPGFGRDLDLVPMPGALQGPLPDRSTRDAFRAWFVALVEQQVERISPAWEPAQRDCAGLLRFAFREAWGPHSATWRDRVGFQGPPVARDPEVRFGGPWRHAFPSPEGWQPFVRGALLREGSCVPLGRDVALARPGDLLFFCRAGAQREPDHAMAVVRPDPEGQPMLVYHTGQERGGQAAQAGEVRRVRVEVLLRHPDPAFRPTPENPAFLGVYRWRVLADEPGL